MQSGTAPGPALPPEVHSLVTSFLHALDVALPDRVEGFYLVGSLALGDYRPDRSDIDFVAVVRESPDGPALGRLSAAHDTVRERWPRPHLDGIYVTWSQLLQNPSSLGGVPFSLEGEFHASGAFEANPAIWLTLRKRAIAFRGPQPPPVRHDAEVLRRWLRENLDSYWQALARQAQAAIVSGRHLPDDAIAWCVPGVLRLRYTLDTGEITSKSGACRHALETLPPRWHDLIEAVLALHRGEKGVTDRAARERDAVELMQFVIDEANRAP